MRVYVCVREIEREREIKRKRERETARDSREREREREREEEKENGWGRMDEYWRDLGRKFKIKERIIIASTIKHESVIN